MCISQRNDIRHTNASPHSSMSLSNSGADPAAATSHHDELFLPVPKAICTLIVPAFGTQPLVKPQEDTGHCVDSDELSCGEMTLNLPPLTKNSKGNAKIGRRTVSRRPAIRGSMYRPSQGVYVVWLSSCSRSVNRSGSSDGSVSLVVSVYYLKPVNYLNLSFAPKEPSSSSSSSMSTCRNYLRT